MAKTVELPEGFELDQPTQLQGGITSYQDILDNNNLSKQEKADQIQARGETERNQLDKNLNDYKKKAYIGAGVAMGGQALDAVPVVGPFLGGAAYSVGTDMIENKTPQEMVPNALATGLLTSGTSIALPLLAKSPVGKFIGRKVGEAAKPLIDTISKSELAQKVGKELVKPRELRIPKITQEQTAFDTLKSLPKGFELDQPIKELPTTEIINEQGKKILASGLEANSSNIAVKEQSKSDEIFNNLNKQYPSKHIDVSPIGLSHEDSIPTLRSKIIGDMNLNTVQSAHLAREIENILPKTSDREALSMMFRYANEPSNVITQDLQNPLFKEHYTAIKKAMNPTPEMQEAFKKVEDYFGEAAQVGPQFGVLDNLREGYLPQKWEQKRYPSGLSKKERIQLKANASKQRVYKTWREGILNGERSATEDVGHHIRLYGQDFSEKLTNRKLMAELESLGGRWIEPNAKEPYEVQFMNMEKSYPIVDKNDRVVRRSGGGILENKRIFVIPEHINEAIQPLLTKDSQGNALIKFARGYNAFQKAGDFSLSLFHPINWVRMKSTDNLTNPRAWADFLQDPKGYSNFLQDSNNRELVKDAVKHGLTETDIDAYKEVYRGISNKLKNSVEDNSAKKLIKLVGQKTFNAFDKYNETLFSEWLPVIKMTEYGKYIEQFAKKYPKATDAEFSTYKRGITKYLNSYGGQNWKVLGISNKVRNNLSALMMAPDWQTGLWTTIYRGFKQIPDLLRGKGTVEGAKSLEHLVKGFIAGNMIGQSINIITTGHPTWENSKNHKADIEIIPGHYMPMFSPVIQEGLKPIEYMADSKNPITSTGKYISNKLSPAWHAEETLRTGKDYFGQPLEKGNNVYSKMLKKSGFKPNDFTNYLLGVSDVTVPMPVGIKGTFTDYTKDEQNPKGYAFDAVGLTRYGKSSIQNNPQIPKGFEIESIPKGFVLDK